jgi:chitodextrinase
LLTAAPVGAQSTIAFVQSNSATPQSPQAAVTARYASAQTAGNANVVVVGWNDTTATVATLTDTAGNTYVKAVGPTKQTGLGTQSIYYAVNIAAAAANTNTVTVTFNAAAQYVDLRIAEYHGIDNATPLDGAVGAVGTGKTSSSGAIVTTYASDLLVGANLVAQGTTAAGTGFTSRVITADLDILEDRVVTAAGSNSATATLTGGSWIMQMVALRGAPVSTDTQPPTAPSNLAASALATGPVSLSWSASTDNVGVVRYRIERCSGAACSGFAQIATSTTLGYSDSTVSGGTIYSYRVRAEDAAVNLSPYSNVATTTAIVLADTTAPTAPSSATAAALSSSQIRVSWTASTDNVGVTNYFVERCSGASCSSFAQVGTAAGTTIDDGGLAVSTAYSYRVRATDAAGNLSAYSNVASATTQGAPDTQAPTAPGTPAATAVSNSQINLSWTAATDNVGVTSYLVERCQGAGCSTFAQVGTSATTSYGDTALAGATFYNYRVRASDAAGNLGPYSAAAGATTQATPTIAFIQANSAVPQSAQANVSLAFTLAQTGGNLNVVVVGWNSSSGQVTSVTDTRGNVYVSAVGPTSVGGFGTQSIYYAAGITPAAANANTVTVAFDSAVPYADIRIAEYSGISSVNPVDVVAAASGSGTSSSSGTVTTTNPADLLVGANLVASGTTGAGTSFTNRVITNPDGDILEDRIVTTAGSYSATAPLYSGTWIMQMVAFKAGAAVPDTQPPSAPSGLTATAPAGTEADLAWTSSTDNVGVIGYRVERCQGAGCATFAEIGVSSGMAAFNDTTVTASLTYSYRVRAGDAAGNLSPYSNIATVTTPAPDVVPPSAPGVLAANAVSGTQIDVSWGAATDNVGVTGYRLERCQGQGCTAFNKLGTTITGTSFSDTSLSVSTSYSYIVRAEDAAGNVGPYSNVAGATTLGTNPQLVAAYSFDEGTGTTVTDLSGHGNNGTIANAAWAATGKFGKALTFNGSSAVVTIPDAPSLHLTTGMSIEAWVNPSVAASDWKDIVYKANDNYYLEGATPGGRPAIGVTIAGSATEAFGGAALAVNTWSFLAATYDGTTLRFYVNGIQVGSQARTGAITTSANPLQIGGDGLYGQFFQGMIDEVRVYNAALSTGQIQADMATATGGSSPAVLFSPAALDLGNQPIGVQSAAVPVTLTNVGSATLNVTGLSITGVQAAEFGQTSNCVGAIAPQGSCTISVTMTPAAAGLRSATLSVADNAPGNPHALPVSGTGVGFSIAPQTAVVTPAHGQQFAANGPGSGSVVWSVDGLAGGSGATGIVSTAGLYTPPSAGGRHLVTVTTTDGARSATATVYVTAHPGVFTHHNDNARTGQNVNETVLTPGNVNSTTFGKLTSYSIDGISHASPLYVANVNIPAVGVRNVVYVATEHDSVYAFDADSTGTSPLWKVSFLSSGVTSVPNGDTGECCDIKPEIGITGTPVIDQASGTLYVVAKTKEGSSTYVQRLHALNIATGAEKFGGPVVIQGSVPGNGTGSTGGTLAFDPLRENQRTGLLLYNGVVYFGFGSHGDIPPYHGWLLGYSATTLQKVLTFVATPNGTGGGIWQSGGGLAIDSSGNFFFATGNGTFDLDTSGIDYANTFLKFNPVGGVLDYFTPHDEGTIDANNLDLDAGGMILLPDQPGAHPHELVSAGKDGTVYMVDRDSMGHFHTPDQNVQRLNNVFPFGTPLPGNYSSPVYFNGAVYFAPVADVVQMFKLSSGLLTTSPTSTTPETFGYPGAALAVSANGTQNGILWAVQKNGTATGTLRAYDASNVAFEIYNSDQAAARDALDVAAKFSIPLVVNGKVFVSSEGRLTVYGLLQ